MGFERKLIYPHVWKRFFFEKFTEPLHVNFMALGVWMFGGFRARVLFDLIIRDYHAFGLLKAADVAKGLGLSQITAVEFGVASGTGLMNMAQIGKKVTKETGVRVNVVGFDSGQGLPTPVDYRDHPNLYKQGDFPMGDFAPLKAALPENVDLQIGDVAETLPKWLSRQTAQSPIAYVVMDLDYYSSTAVALKVFSERPELYLPFVITYFDDVIFDEHNDACGELLAIHEFNGAHKNRILQPPPFLTARRVYKNAPWLKQIYYCHILDHAVRARSQGTAPLVMDNPFV